MSHHTPTDAAAPTNGPFQGVHDREIHREIDTADLFYDPASTNQDFSKPPPLKSAFPPSDLHASSPPDDIARLLNAAPAGELGGAEDCETCLSCKKAKRAAESWAELDEFTCACEDQAVEGGGVSLADHNRQESSTEAGLGTHWSLASNPRATNGAIGFGIRSGSQGTADIWTGAPKH